MTDISKVPARIIEIADALESNLRPIFDRSEIIASHNDAVKAMNDEDNDGGANSPREVAIVALAELSARNTLTEAEITSASNLAAAKIQGNKDKLPSSVAKFVGDLRTAMHPKVCASVLWLVNVRNDAWDREDAALSLNKNADAPLRKAWKRRYHTLKAIMTATLEGSVFADVAALVAYARAKDPDLDFDRVEKRMKAIFKEIADFAQDFPVDEFKTMVDCAPFITKNDLAQARARLLGVSVEVVLGLPQRPTAPAPRAVNVAPEPAPAPAPTADDIIDSTPAATVAAKTVQALAPKKAPIANIKGKAKAPTAVTSNGLDVLDEATAA